MNTEMTGGPNYPVLLSDRQAYWPPLPFMVHFQREQGQCGASLH